MRLLITLIACLSLVLTTRAQRVGVEYQMVSALPAGQTTIILAAGTGTNFTTSTAPLVKLASSSGQGSRSLLVSGATVQAVGANVEACWSPSDGVFAQTNMLTLFLTVFPSVNLTNNIVFASNAPNTFAYAPYGYLRSLTNRGAQTIYITNLYQGVYAR